MIHKSAKKRPRKKGSRLGATVVEFAIVGPLMILLTMGMLELGRAVMVQQLLINASREGARLAVLPGVTTSDVSALVNQELSDQTINGATVTTVPSDLSTASSGSSITVTVSVPAASVSWIPNPAFTYTSILEAETTMRRESN